MVFVDGIVVFITIIGGVLSVCIVIIWCGGEGGGGGGWHCGNGGIIIVVLWWLWLVCSCKCARRGPVIMLSK